MFKKLKIEKIPKYLSPSALITALKTPNIFYLTRLINNPIAREPQGKGAAAGTAFDILIKRQLWDEGINPESKKIYNEKLERGLEDPDFKKEALQIGKKILYQYNILAKKETNFKKIEIWKKFTKEGIPIFTKLDSTCLENDFEIPFDWKCGGFNPDSESGVSPKQGFITQFQGNKYLKAHKKYHLAIKMKEIYLDWAIQLCTYGWALELDNDLTNGFEVKVDQITNSAKNTIKISTFLANIDIEFQKILINTYKKIWNELHNESFMNKITSKYDFNLVYIHSKNESWTRSLIVKDDIICLK